MKKKSMSEIKRLKVISVSLCGEDGGEQHIFIANNDIVEYFRKVLRITNIVDQINLVMNMTDDKNDSDMYELYTKYELDPSFKENAKKVYGSTDTHALCHGFESDDTYEIAAAYCFNIYY